MIHLPTVDLVATDGVSALRLIHPVLHTLRFISFRRVLLFAPECPPQLCRHITTFHERRWDYEEWNRFMARELREHIYDGHVLNIHYDGYVLNPSAWRHHWLEYDYIGAPWHYEDGGQTVGNGGFSLRSKRYLESSASIELQKFAPEDDLLIRVNGQRLMSEFGIRFAPTDLAAEFALEGNSKFGHEWFGQFGFHNYGITNTALAFTPPYLNQINIPPSPPRPPPKPPIIATDPATSEPRTDTPPH